MDDDIIKTIKIVMVFILLATIIITIVLPATLVFIGNGFEYFACKNLEEISTLEHHWDILNGCLVKYNNYWFKPEEFPYKELEIK